MRKIGMLVLAVILCMAFACTGLAEGGYEEKLELVWMGYTNVSGTPFYDDDPVKDLIEERYNVAITKVPVDWTSKEQISLYFAEGNMPDVMLCRQLSRETLIDEGLIRSYPVEWMYEYMPNYMAYLTGYIDPAVVSQQLEIDGQCWGIPQTTEGDTSGFSCGIINMTWAKAVGIEKVPETLEEYHDYCYKVTFEDPDGNGQDDTYGISNAGYWYGGLMPIFVHYNVSPNSWYLVDGKVTHSVQTENYKKVLETIAAWYAEGIIDPEFATKGWTEYQNTVLTGKIGTFTHMASEVYGSDIPKLQAVLPECEFDVMPCIVDYQGEKAVNADYPALFENEPIYFGTETTDEEVIRAMQIIDALISDPELVLKHYFVSDEYYTVDEDGSYSYIPGFYDMDQSILMEQGYNYYCSRVSMINPIQTYSAATTELLQERAPYKKVYWGMGFGYSGVCEAYNELNGELKTFENNYALSVILGQANLEESFEGFLNEWSASGGQKVLDEFQTILDAE